MKFERIFHIDRTFKYYHEIYIIMHYPDKNGQCTFIIFYRVLSKIHIHYYLYPSCNLKKINNQNSNTLFSMADNYLKFLHNIFKF